MMSSCGGCGAEEGRTSGDGENDRKRGAWTCGKADEPRSTRIPAHAEGGGWGGGGGGAGGGVGVQTHKKCKGTGACSRPRRPTDSHFRGFAAAPVQAPGPLRPRDHGLD